MLILDKLKKDFSEISRAATEQSGIVLCVIFFLTNISLMHRHLKSFPKNFSCQNITLHTVSILLLRERVSLRKNNVVRDLYKHK